MLEFEEAQTRSDAKAMDLANRKVELFTQQLDESNPVLTAISDCMTAEGELRADAAATSDAKRQAELLAKAEVKRLEKEAGNLKLQVVRTIALGRYTGRSLGFVGSCRAQPNSPARRRTVHRGNCDSAWRHCAVHDGTVQFG